LRSMDGGGVTETGRLMYLIAGQSDGQVAAGGPHRRVTAPPDTGDGPPVAILNPVGCGESEAAVVGPGDDHISDTGLIPISQTHLRRRRGLVEAIITGATVEFGDKLASGCEHDRVTSG
jgi:hypothetical protein